MNYIQHWLFMTHQAEPLRPTSLLMLLAGAIGHGDSLVQGLKSYANEHDGEWAGKVSQLRVLLEQGLPLSTAVVMVRDLLPIQTVMAIRMAEKSSCLSEVLLDEARRLSGQVLPQQGTRVSLESLLLWSALVGTILLAIVSFLMILIVPKLKVIYTGFDVQFPPSLRVLIEIGELLTYSWYVYLPPVIYVAFYGCWRLYRNSCHRLIHGYYSIERYLPRLWVPDILRLMSLSVATNNPVSMALDSAMQDMPEGRAAEKLSSVRHRVHSGEDPVEAMAVTGLLKQREMLFLQSALRTGHLDWALRHLASQLDRQRQRWLSAIPEVTGPLVIMSAGGIVLFICVAFFGPLVTLISELGKP